MPTDVRSARKWVKIAGIVSTGIVTIATPLLILYVEYAPQIREAQQGAVTSYEAIAPAVSEIQGILSEAEVWSKYTDKSIGNLEAALKGMERRLARCEAYIEVIANRRRMPSIAEDADELVSEPEPPSEERQPAPPAQRATRYDIPANLEKAKKRVKERKEMKCGPLDPLCGTSE